MTRRPRRAASKRAASRSERRRCRTSGIRGGPPRPSEAADGTARSSSTWYDAMRGSYVVHDPPWPAPSPPSASVLRLQPRKARCAARTSSAEPGPGGCDGHHYDPAQRRGEYEGQVEILHPQLRSHEKGAVGWPVLVWESRAPVQRMPRPPSGGGPGVRCSVVNPQGPSGGVPAWFGGFRSMWRASLEGALHQAVKAGIGCWPRA